MQSQFVAQPHGIALKPFDGAKGILIVEHDAGEEAIVAQFYDNYLNGLNRIHRHAEMFIHLPTMLQMLKRIVDEWPAFDRDDEVSGADLVNWFANFRLDTKTFLAEIESAIVESSTDAGIQGLQLTGETDETSVLPVPNVLAVVSPSTKGVACKCDNCGYVCDQQELKPIADIAQRLDHPVGHPDCVMPAGECPKCGALAYQQDDSAVPVWTINVRCLVNSPSDLEDESLEGKYEVLFDPEAADFSKEKLASIALDVFHAKQGINELDEFEITVMDSHGQPVDQDQYHVQGTGEGFANVEMVDVRPVQPDSQDNQPTADGLREQFSPDGAGEHPKYARSDWREDVRQENTTRGVLGLGCVHVEQEADNEVLSEAPEYFPERTQEVVGSIIMHDIVGDFSVPSQAPEWVWVEQAASFGHVRNGQDGVWEFVLNLACHHDDIPETLKPVLAEAKQKNLSYLVFHQG